MRLSEQRQEMMCTVHAGVSKMTQLKELSSVLSDRFIFPTTVFAVNEDIFQPPHFGVRPDGQSFTENMNITYQRYFWYQIEGCTVPREQLVPRMDILLGRTEPIFVCALHFWELPLGYCVFQPELTIDDYAKMYTFMITINASFGAFHSQLQIQSINAQLKQVNEELEQLYVHDYLTGLYNRRGYHELALPLYREMAGGGGKLLILFLDMDRLKHINDVYGHAEGDRAIRCVAAAIQENLPQNAIPVRYGGDEFLVLIPNVDGEAVPLLLDSIETALPALAEAQGLPEVPGISSGFVLADPSCGRSLDEYMHEADERMYRAKALYYEQTGKDRRRSGK
jgi:diguanylate cyclase (GGDEF)-like protein